MRLQTISIKELGREQVLAEIISERDIMIMDLNAQVIQITKDKEQLLKDKNMLQEKVNKLEGKTSEDIKGD